MQITTDPTVFLEQVANPYVPSGGDGASSGSNDVRSDHGARPSTKQPGSGQNPTAPLKCQPMLMGDRDAAGYLGISVSKLRMMKLPKRVLGSRKLYDRQDLDDFINELPYEGSDTSKANSDVDAWFEAHG